MKEMRCWPSVIPRRKQVVERTVYGVRSRLSLRMFSEGCFLPCAAAYYLSLLSMRKIEDKRKKLAATQSCGIRTAKLRYSHGKIGGCGRGNMLKYRHRRRCLYGFLAETAGIPESRKTVSGRSGSSAWCFPSVCLKMGAGGFPNLKIPHQNPRLHYFQTIQFWR